MDDNSLFKIVRLLKRLLVYQPPQLPDPFVLKEKPNKEEPAQTEFTASVLQLNRLLEHARQLAAVMEKIVLILKQGKAAQEQEAMIGAASLLEKQQNELIPIMLSYDANIDPKQRTISTKLQENRNVLREIYYLPQNKDAVVRNFMIPSVPPLRAMLVYIDGLVDKKIINDSILCPLLKQQKKLSYIREEDLARTIADTLLPSNQVQIAGTFQELIDAINSGDTALLLEGTASALLMDTKGYERRSIDRPQMEQTVRGGQASFTESLRVNTAQIRVTMPTNDLITEMILVGDRIPLKCAVMYLQSVANSDLVTEIKRRIKGISTDYIPSMAILAQFIEDHPGVDFPQSLSTERVDRVAAHLAEGRIAVLLEGSSFVYMFPVNFFTFFQTSEDFNLSVGVGTFMRFLRWIGTVLVVLLPAIYIAINYYHQEALPTDLALAIAGAREQVPFPALFEILLMELSFELIREAGLRVPGILGSTIGIVGAIILGQAAVSAKIVSPIMVVLIALTGVASFTIPDYRMAFALRIYRFGLLLLASFLGFAGIAFGLVVLTGILTSMKSLGVPYLTPLGPRTSAGMDVVTRGPVFRQEQRPDELNTKNQDRQPKISRQWRTEKPTGEGARKE
ncbi:putative membrane protein [Propionispora sp. 2/2-37]|uniref:spore germination protein n=1 Tax=Propionispora sp. 2/2-37 TaxID=1677858 RepID=UPI0006BB7389|nr:spore germination protein [Propionispora sp. 2/2-37]CUH94966.1 putative membrane protein [Propionispora sp. 2/2-37]